MAIDSAGVVPGDVLVLTPGTQAATDAKLITSSRSSNEPLSSPGPFSNRALNIMVMSVAAFLAIALGVPAVGSYFKLTPSRCPGWPPPAPSPSSRSSGRRSSRPGISTATEKQRRNA